MTHDHEDPLQHPQVQLAKGSHTVTGYIVSVVLMGLALATVAQHDLSSADLWAVTGVMAGGAVLAQLYFWLRLNFSPAQRWTTISFLLFVPLFVITVGLTAWMFQTLYARTMLPGMMS